jgi:sRNA-binding regulator protein Hfq
MCEENNDFPVSAKCFSDASKVRQSKVTIFLHNGQYEE